MDFEIVRVIFQRGNGLMPISCKDLTSVTRKALIYLDREATSGGWTSDDRITEPLTFAHGPEYRSFWGTYPEADSYESQTVADHAETLKVERTAALAPAQQSLVSR